MKIRLFSFITLCLFLSLESECQWTVICSTGDGFVDNFETYNGELYATGFFTTLCETPNNYVARYDGSTWQAAGNGFIHAGHHLAVIDSILYGVRYEPDIDSNWLYKYDGSNFNKYGEGVFLTTAVTGFSQTASLYNMIKYNGSLVVCGEFDRVGSKLISGIMRWNGTQWDSLASGFSGNIPGTAPVMYPHDLCIFGTDLVAAGNFKNAGGQPVNGIARWDGTEWHAMGPGFNSTVYGICVFNGELYAGGDFTSSGGTSVNYIAKWNGSAWVDPGFCMFYINPFDYTFIHTLKVLNNKLYISGGFDRAVSGTDTMHCTGVAAYDGVNIDTLHGGLPGKEVEALAIYNGLLIAGGGLNGSSYIAGYDLAISVEDIQSSGIQVRVFPNPATSSFSTLNIESKRIIDKVSVSDLSGQVVYRAAPKAKSASFIPDHAGIYFVWISSGGQSVTKKLIVTD